MTGSSGFKNRFPIILVHGFTGWGREELAGFKYWGGKVDIEAQLNDLGFHTRTATVGPVSSSWERAVDLYYFLVGGRVDYGAAHAKKYGVKRFGHIFAGIYPQISETNKIHLVGHSMGGQTICEFEAMLRNGSKEERDYHKAHPDEDGISDLFLGGKEWVCSITGIAPGFNGTPALHASNDPASFTNLVRQLMLSLASTAGGDPEEFFYDFKLDHWGFKREAGEPFVQYLERIFESDIWRSSNVAVYDLGTTGAAKIARERLQSFPETYYFSFGGKATFTNVKTGHALPIPTINPVMIPGALMLGRMNIDPELPGGLDLWRNNDGCVPCAGASYVIGQPHRAADLNELSYPRGQWNAFPLMHGWDHADFVGIGIPYALHRKDIMPFYTNLARILTSIESTAESEAPQAASTRHTTHAATKHDAPHKAAATAKTGSAHTAKKNTKQKH